MVGTLSAGVEQPDCPPAAGMSQLSDGAAVETPPTRNVRIKKSLILCTAPCAFCPCSIAAMCDVHMDITHLHSNHRLVSNVYMKQNLEEQYFIFSEIFSQLKLAASPHEVADCLTAVSLLMHVNR